MGICVVEDSSGTAPVETIFTCYPKSQKEGNACGIDYEDYH